ncbi:MAG: hypothetical protein QM724_00530 [Flavobacteriales bacterium]
MMRTTFLIAWALLAAASLRGQWWADAGLPVSSPSGVIEMYEDTATNTLYCMGQLDHAVGTPEQASYFCMYHEGEWTMSAPFNNSVLTAIRYRDTLIVGGVFTKVNGQNIRYIAAYYNGQWSSYGNIDGYVRALRILNGELYAFGGFKYADGHWCGGVAKRVRNSWQNVGYFPANGSSVVGDGTIYQGNLVVAGTLTFSGLPFLHLAAFDGENWGTLGPGVAYPHGRRRAPGRVQGRPLRRRHFPPQRGQRRPMHHAVGRPGVAPRGHQRSGCHRRV